MEIRIIINKIVKYEKADSFAGMFFSVQTMLWADNDKPIQIGQLPTKAQTLITTYFKGYKVALAKMESGVFYKNYEWRKIGIRSFG